ncbi:unnamed protein product [Bursaphelenchus xylophilus]|uniref:(pine wood nematode) hypothetical protein n=1 Tax=Bursaphelenchus xylophilus TaxID=6326 RepID=A0A1I7RTI5_BURXY|nr:unnamed protein product [Bursaphelenchus xylophilus]CAG9122415.1 unnamed protein product [Bursaphelenchus xylophilus]
MWSANYSMDWDRLRVDPVFEGRESIYHIFGNFYLIFGVFNSILNILFTIKLASITVFHVNYRIQVCSTVIAMELMHLSMPTMHFYNDYFIDHTDRFYVNIGCAIIGLLNNVMAAAVAISMFMLALERQLAYHWVNVYEEKPNTLGCVLGMCVCVQSFAIGAIFWYFFLFIVDDFDLNTSKVSCVTTDLHWEWEFGAFTIGALTCSIGYGWLRLLLTNTKRGREKRLALTSLSARYQATENSYTTASIAPSMGCYTTACLIGMVMAAIRGYFVYLYGENTMISRVSAEIGFFVVDLYAISHMFCIVYFNPILKNILYRDLKAFLNYSETKSTCKIDYAHETETYFDQLKNAWG